MEIQLQLVRPETTTMVLVVVMYEYTDTMVLLGYNSDWISAVKQKQMD